MGKAIAAAGEAMAAESASGGTEITPLGDVTDEQTPAMSQPGQISLDL